MFSPTRNGEMLVQKEIWSDHQNALDIHLTTVRNLVHKIPSNFHLPNIRQYGYRYQGSVFPCEKTFAG